MSISTQENFPRKDNVIGQHKFSIGKKILELKIFNF